MEFLARLDGTQTRLSAAELLTLLQPRLPGCIGKGEKGPFLSVVPGPGARGWDSGMYRGFLKELAGTLSLCHSISLVLRTLDREDFLDWLDREARELPDRELAGLWGELGQISGTAGGPGSFRVDCHFAIPKEGQRELYPDSSTVKRSREQLGALLLKQAAGSATVSLESPDTVLTVFLGEEVLLGYRFECHQRSDFQGRKVGNRPFFSPISLEPRWARASVNLLGLEPPATIYDPFCGTGGILLEAALLGHKVLGSDLDPRMVQGTGQNLRHFGVEPALLFQSDIGDCGRELAARGSKVDAVVSDLPYGRASSLAREDRDRLYARSFKAVSELLSPGSPALLVLPDSEAARSAEEQGLVLREIFPVYIHRSLTRYFCLYQKK